MTEPNWWWPKDFWKDKTVAVVASGPSLTQADCELLHKHSITTMCVNNAYKLCPWADALYSGDFAWWSETYPEIVAQPFQGMMATSAFTAQHGGIQFIWQMYFKRPDVRLVPRLMPQFGGVGIISAGSSGFDALQLAAVGGAKRILLLGFDMCESAGKPSHFHGDHPDILKLPVVLPPGYNNKYEFFRAAFDAFAPILRQHGIQVVNCAVESALTCFPKMKLSEVL